MSNYDWQANDPVGYAQAQDAGRIPGAATANDHGSGRTPTPLEAAYATLRERVEYLGLLIPETPAAQAVADELVECVETFRARLRGWNETAHLRDPARPVERTISGPVS